MADPVISNAVVDTACGLLFDLWEYRISNDHMRAAITAAILADRKETIAAKDGEISALRSIISKCADALGNGAIISHDCSVEFMRGLPSEIGLHVASLTEELETLRCERAADKRDAERYRWLRSRDVDTISSGGIFIGVTPENLVVNFDDADARVDGAIKANIDSPEASNEH